MQNNTKILYSTRAYLNCPTYAGQTGSFVPTEDSIEDKREDNHTTARLVHPHARLPGRGGRLVVALRGHQGGHQELRV